MSFLADEKPCTVGAEVQLSTDYVRSGYVVWGVSEHPWVQFPLATAIRLP